MRTQQILLALSAVGAAYFGLALSAASRGSVLSDPVPPAAAETSGTRLKAKVTTGSDGSKLFDAEVLYDTVLEADCIFHKAADGVERCLPIIGPDAYGNSATYAYTDDQCTNRVVFLDAPPGGCPQHLPKYASEYLPIPYCGATEPELGLRIFEVGALVGNPSPTYVKNGQGDCVQGGGGSGVAYALSAELDPTTFVEGTQGVDP